MPKPKANQSLSGHPLRAWGATATERKLRRYPSLPLLGRRPSLRIPREGFAERGAGMTFVLMVFLAVVCLFEAYPAAPWGGPPWLAPALTFGSLLALAAHAAGGLCTDCFRSPIVRFRGSASQAHRFRNLSGAGVSTGDNVQGNGCSD